MAKKKHKPKEISPLDFLLLALIFIGAEQLREEREQAESADEER